MAVIEFRGPAVGMAGYTLSGFKGAIIFQKVALLGEYDFSAEKLRDSVGIRLPKLGAKKEVFLDLIQTHKPQCTERIR